MLRKILNIKVILSLAFSAMVLMSYASFSIANPYRDDDKDKDKKKGNTERLSLKDIQRPDSFFSLSSISSANANNNNLRSFGRFQFMSLDSYSDEQARPSKSVKVQSSIKVTTGNQVVVYPYSYKIKPAPFGLFKTPIGR